MMSVQVKAGMAEAGRGRRKQAKPRRKKGKHKQEIIILFNLIIQTTNAIPTSIAYPYHR